MFIRVVLLIFLGFRKVFFSLSFSFFKYKVRSRFFYGFLVLIVGCLVGGVAFRWFLGSFRGFFVYWFIGFRGVDIFFLVYRGVSEFRDFVGRVFRDFFSVNRFFREVF